MANDDSLKSQMSKIIASPLSDAVVNNDYKTVEKLLKDGVDPNELKYDKSRPLLYAAWNKNIHIIRILLEYGANPNLSNDIGLTPLMYSASFGHMDAVKLLINSGANPDIVFPDQQWKAWMFAQKYGHKEVADYLKSISKDTD